MTPEQINAARADNISKGLPAYSGAGATATNPGPTPNVYGGGAITSSGIISQNGVDPIKPNTPISATDLQQTNPLKVPSPYVSTTADGIIGTAAALTQTQKELQAKEDAAANAAASAKDQSKSDLQSTFDQIAGIQSGRVQAEADAKLGEKQQKLTDATNALEKSQRAQTNELRALDGQGLTDVQKAASAKEINRRYAFEQADLSLIQSAANRDYSTAQSIVDRKIELALEPLKTKLDFQKIFYEDNKDAFTKAEDRQFQNLITQSQREYDQTKIQTKALEDAKLEALKNASEQNAPDDVKRAIQAATTPEGAITAAGIYGGDLKRKLEIEKLQKEAAAIAGGGRSDDLLAYASDMASTGKLPSPTEVKASGLTVGKVAEMARTLPQPAGFIANASTGVKDSTIPAAEQTDYQRLYNITKNVQRLKELDSRIAQVGSTSNEALRARNEYSTITKSIVDDISRMQSGAALTPDEISFYANYLPDGYRPGFGGIAGSSKKIDNFNKIMNDRLSERLNNKGLVIYGYSTVDVGGKTYKIGDTIELENGKTGRILPGGYVSTQ